MKTLILQIALVIFCTLSIAAGGDTTDNAVINEVKVDRVIVKKSERKLILMTGDNILKSYNVALGHNPVGPKKREGDNKTPEGTYIIDRHNPNSSFHLSLHISYPSETDREQAFSSGVHPGSNIMIHGLKNGMGWIGSLHLTEDWTQGCIAVTNEEIEEIYTLVADGTPIDLQP